MDQVSLLFITIAPSFRLDRNLTARWETDSGRASLARMTILRYSVRVILLICFCPFSNTSARDSSLRSEWPSSDFVLIPWILAANACIRPLWFGNKEIRLVNKNLYPFDTAKKQLLYTIPPFYAVIKIPLEKGLWVNYRKFSQKFPLQRATANIKITSPHK